MNLFLVYGCYFLNLGEYVTLLSCGKSLQWSLEKLLYLFRCVLLMWNVDDNLFFNNQYD